MNERERVLAESSAFCRLCRETEVPTSFGSPRRCGWDAEGNFSRDNWNCGTLNALREYAGEGDFEGVDAGRGSWWYRANDASIAVISIPEGIGTDEVDYMGYIVLTYYKSRGCTSRGIVVDDDEDPEPLSLAMAEATLAALNGASNV